MDKLAGRLHEMSRALVVKVKIIPTAFTQVGVDLNVSLLHLVTVKIKVNNTIEWNNATLTATPILVSWLAEQGYS